ncbi:MULTISPECIES: polymorphic toxin type 33 domain-containing protein, partial [Spirulina sp. CCY15215]|uniref:polymorphic toxin type 33 domain-containing protein n=1 Tax=Spirulina sp. CCY15215 TaxID=2767591 RepID=UPI001951F1D8
GNVTDVYTYDAYGNLTNSVGNSENDYLFAGEQFDGTLEQYYLRQRYYDPSTGRFTRRDTYEGDHFEPITLHKYLYANANPINGIDPSGLFTLTEVNSVFAQIGQLASQSYATFTPLLSTLSTRLALALFLAKYGIFIAAINSEDGAEENDDIDDENIDDDYMDRDTKEDAELSKKDIKKLKKAGYDIHELKGKENASKRDLYKDQKGNVYVKPKGMRNAIGEPTGINLKKLK